MQLSPEALSLHHTIAHAGHAAQAVALGIVLAWLHRLSSYARAVPQAVPQAVRSHGRGFSGVAVNLPAIDRPLTGHTGFMLQGHAAGPRLGLSPVEEPHGWEV